VIASRIEEDNGGHSLSHEDPERKIENFKEMGGNAGKVLVSPRNETLEKVHVFCLV
jgi:hypothetical protein